MWLAGGIEGAQRGGDLPVAAAGRPSQASVACGSPCPLQLAPCGTGRGVSDACACMHVMQQVMMGVMMRPHTCRRTALPDGRCENGARTRHLASILEGGQGRLSKQSSPRLGEGGLWGPHLDWLLPWLAVLVLAGLVSAAMIVAPLALGLGAGCWALALAGVAHKTNLCKSKSSAGATTAAWHT